MKYFNVIILAIIAIIFSSYNYTSKNYDYMIDTKYISYVEKLAIKNESKTNSNVLKTFYGTITAYEPNCDGCIGITASGYDVQNTIYYNDQEYGKIRIIAADRTLPFGTIVNFSTSYLSDILAIVLDRGGAISFDGGAQVDLLFSNSDDAFSFGRQNNVEIKILRFGFD